MSTATRGSPPAVFSPAVRPLVSARRASTDATAITARSSPSGSGRDLGRPSESRREGLGRGAAGQILGNQPWTVRPSKGVLKSEAASLAAWLGRHRGKRRQSENDVVNKGASAESGRAMKIGKLRHETKRAITPLVERGRTIRRDQGGPRRNTPMLPPFG